MRVAAVIIAVTLFFGCAPVQRPSKVPGPARLTPEQQKAEALNLFKKVLEVAETKGDSPDGLQERVQLLKEMARRYPDAPLSQEAYWHIINIYLNKYYPPRIEEAERTYQEFLRLYPVSPMKNAIESTLNLFYFQHKMWDKLVQLHRERIKHFIATGTIDSPFYFYMYSLAKMNLGQLDEAEKGFKWIILKYPNTQAAKDSKRQLKKLQKMKNKTGGRNGRS